MYIKEYDFFEYSLNYKKYFSIDYRDHIIEHVSSLLKEGPFNNIKEFLHSLTESFKNGLFQYFAITIDDTKNLIYISDLYYYDYYLSKDFSAPKIIQLCHENSLSYNIMTKDNFIHLLTKWNQFLTELPLFILLYQNDQDWYDLLPFDSKEAIDKFVADHTK